MTNNRERGVVDRTGLTEKGRKMEFAAGKTRFDMEPGDLAAQGKLDGVPRHTEIQRIVSR